jgi:hypothetical protein
MINEFRADRRQAERSEERNLTVGGARHSLLLTRFGPLPGSSVEFLG